MIYQLVLKDGEVLKCDHCTQVVYGDKEGNIIVYLEETEDNSDSDLMIRCQTCHETLQESEASK